MIYRIEYNDLQDPFFYVDDISNFHEVDKMYREDQFYKVLDENGIKKIIAWGYDGVSDMWNLTEYILADYINSIRFDPYDYKEMYL